MPKEIAVSDDGFLMMLRGLNKGAVVDELDRELMTGIQAILANGGSSKITLTIDVKRIKNLESAVTISHDVKAVHPREERPAKAMFITSGNGLTDQQQDQGALPLGEGSSAPRSTLGQGKSNVTKIGG